VVLRSTLGTSLLLLLVLPAGPALAHTGSGGGFVTGLSHPISGLDHVIAMIAVGLWGAQLGRPALWLLPVMFPLVMAFGAFAALLGMGLPGVEVGIAVSAVALGAAILFEFRPTLAVSVGLVSFFAVFHGHAHGTELPADQSGVLYSVGFVISTGLLHAAGIGIGIVHRWGFGRIAIRVLGGLILLGGLYFLYGALA
jgi:urease accessory protein